LIKTPPTAVKVKERNHEKGERERKAVSWS